MLDLINNGKMTVDIKTWNPSFVFFGSENRKQFMKYGKYDLDNRVNFNSWSMLSFPFNYVLFSFSREQSDWT